MARKKKTSAADRYKKLLDKVQGMDLGSSGYWKPSEGRNTIRVLPAVGEMEFFFHEVGRHYDQRQYCPAISTDGAEECPICELNEQLFQSGEKEAASKFRANRAFWMNIIDRKNRDAGPQIYTPGIQVFQAIVSLVSDADYGDVTDLDEGFDLKLDRKGTGLETKYTVLPAPRPSPLGDDDEIDEWLEEAEDLAARIDEQLKDYDELIKAAGLGAYFGLEDDEDDDEDDYEGMEWADDDDDEEEEEPVRPTRRRRRSRRTRR